MSLYISKCNLFILIVQFGAAGSHSDVLVHMRLAEPDRLNPWSHVYVAVANRLLFPSMPAVMFNNPFSRGNG